MGMIFIRFEVMNTEVSAL